jgi:hypothetical protein
MIGKTSSGLDVHRKRSQAASIIRTRDPQSSSLRKAAVSADSSKPWYLLEPVDILNEEMRDEAYLRWVERKLGELTSNTKEKLRISNYIKLQQSQYARHYHRNNQRDDTCSSHLKRSQLQEEIDKIDHKIALLEKETRRDFDLITRSLMEDCRTAEQLKHHRMRSDELLSQTQTQLIQLDQQREVYLQGKMDQWRRERVCRATFNETFCDGVLSQMDRYQRVRAIVRYGLLRFARTVLRLPAFYSGKSVFVYRSIHADRNDKN